MKGIDLGPPLADESAQVGAVFFAAQTLAQDSVLQGYDRHATAEGLLHAARELLADDQEFMAVLDRFLKLRRVLQPSVKLDDVF